MKTPEQWVNERDWMGGEYDTKERIAKLIKEVQDDAVANPPAQRPPATES